LRAVELPFEVIGFVGIDERLGAGRYVFRNQVLLDGVGMDPVIDLGQLPVEVPAEGEAAVFFALEPLVILDDVKLEFRRDPGGEFKGYVLIGESGGIPALLGHDTFGSRLFHPSLRREHKAVQACLTFNCLEFEVIELGVVEMLPQATPFPSGCSALSIEVLGIKKRTTSCPLCVKVVRKFVTC